MVSNDMADEIMNIIEDFQISFVHARMGANGEVGITHPAL